MDISKQFDSIVAQIVDEIQNKVKDQVTNSVKAELKSYLEKYDFDSTINKMVDEKLDEKISNVEIDQGLLQKKVTNASNLIINTIETDSKQKINNLISTQIADVNFEKLLSTATIDALSTKIKHITFPDSSIPASSIKQDEIRLSGDQIQGGIITKFGSTGIDDRASKCVVTILDEAVVVENNLVTLDLTVKGNLVVEGHVPEDSEFYKQLTNNVSNRVKLNLNDELFSGFSDTIFTNIREQGLDLTKITINNQTVIEGTRIGYSITESNLQKLGLLKELQVQGEAQIAETLYVGNKRAGINTVEPSAALAVWDEDVEITVSKFKDHTGRISTPRNQTLVLGSNRHNNIILDTDGSTKIDDLKVGEMRFTTSNTPPNYLSQKGHVVFNSNPNVGGPLGWICLGGANWANFGIID